MTNPLPTIKGFDRQGEPELRAGEKGALELVFNFMPPQMASGEEREPELFDKFETVLSNALGVAVTRDDREVFLIASPQADTAARAAAYLSSFWKDHAEPLKADFAAVPRPANAPFRNHKECKTSLLDSLSAAMTPHGFKAVKSTPDAAVRRKTPFGTETLWASAHDIGAGFHCGLFALVTHDLIERIHAQASNMERRFFKGQWTLSFPAPNGTDRGMSRVIKRPSDADAWAGDIAANFTSKMAPALERCSDPAYVESIFNGRILDPDFEMIEAVQNAACKGLILAKLLDRSDLEASIAYHDAKFASLDIETAFPAVKDLVRTKSADDITALAKLWDA